MGEQRASEVATTQYHEDAKASIYDVTVDEDYATASRSELSRSLRLQPPWNEKRVLLLNGDAHSGIASLFILRELMKLMINFEKKENPRTNNSKTTPLMRYFDNVVDDFRFCHYFDYISGVSTGGIAAVLLGQGRLTIDETIDHIQGIWDFQRPGRLSWSYLFSDQRADNSREVHSRLHKYIEPQSILNQLRDCNSATEICMEVSSKFRAVPGMCQTLVFASTKSNPSRVDVFRSYPVSQEQTEDQSDATLLSSIVNVCRALVADPAEFREVKVPSKPGDSYQAVTNDVEPSSLINEELLMNHPEAISAQTLLEIGNHPHKDAGLWFSYFRQRTNTGGQPKTAAQDVNYFHFDGPTATNGLSFDRIRTITETYCSSPPVKANLEEWAKKLVTLRRARARTMEWQTFALAVRYSCCLCLEQGLQPGLMNRPAFFDHVDDGHDFYSLPPAEMFRIQEMSRIEV